MRHADLKKKGEYGRRRGTAVVVDGAEVLSAGHLSGEVEEKQLICFNIIVLVFKQNWETERDWEEMRDEAQALEDEKMGSTGFLSMLCVCVFELFQCIKDRASHLGFLPYELLNRQRALLWIQLDDYRFKNNTENLWLVELIDLTYSSDAFFSYCMYMYVLYVSLHFFMICIFFCYILGYKTDQNVSNM